MSRIRSTSALKLNFLINFLKENGTCSGIRNEALTMIAVLADDEARGLHVALATDLARVRVHQVAARALVRAGM